MSVNSINNNKYSNDKNKFNNKYSTNYSMKRIVKSTCVENSPSCILGAYSNSDSATGCFQGGGCHVGSFGNASNGCPCLGPSIGLPDNNKNAQGCITSFNGITNGYWAGGHATMVTSGGKSFNGPVTGGVIPPGSDWSVYCSGFNCYWLSAYFTVNGQGTKAFFTNNSGNNTCSL